MSDTISNTRILDGDKLLKWLDQFMKEVLKRGSEDGEHVLDAVMEEIETGQFDSPSNQGEAARLREALEWYADKDNYDWYEVGDVPVMQDEGNLAREALSSHTEDKP